MGGVTHFLITVGQSVCLSNVPVTGVKATNTSLLSRNYLPSNSTRATVLHLLPDLHPSPAFVRSLKNKGRTRLKLEASAEEAHKFIFMNEWRDVITCLGWAVGWARDAGRRGREGEIRGGQIMTSTKAKLEGSRWGLSPRWVHSSNYWGRKRSLFLLFNIGFGGVATRIGRVGENVIKASPLWNREKLYVL